MAALDLLKVPVATKVRVPSSQQTSKLGSRQILQVKAQRYRDQEDAERSSSNMVDGSLSVLKRRIAEVKTKESLERCRRSSSCDIVGWNYSSSSSSSGYYFCPNRLRRRPKAEASEVLWKMLLLVFSSISFTVISGTALLCFASLLIHLPS